MTNRLIILTILYGSGTGLLWYSSSWKVTLGVWILLWALRTEEKMDQEDKDAQFQPLLERMQRMRRK